MMVALKDILLQVLLAGSAVFLIPFFIWDFLKQLKPRQIAME
ncbi:hypothetical protein N6H13_13525 [Paenibacillus sp. CC-CFT742]|nr:hypothetical protein [Paenibacillus sp. CC-CFT742]WJH31463.1 hypothetical protein N6H13_13525 [Paenibacillus sp. CC-CFT742]